MYLYTCVSFYIVAFVIAYPPPNPGCECLSDGEAVSIATTYLPLYDTGAVTSLAQVTAVLAQNFPSYDEVGPFNTGPYSSEPSITGVQAFFESVIGLHKRYPEATVFDSFLRPDRV